VLPTRTVQCAGILASTLFAALIGGCGQAEPQGLPPVDQELSPVPGVSIRRRPETLSRAKKMEGLGSSELTAESADLFDVFCFFADFGGPIYNDAPLPAGRYDISVKAGPNQDRWELLKEAYERAFAVRVRQINRPEYVHILVRDEGHPLALATPAPGTHRGWGTENTQGGFGYRFRNSSMDDLARVIEKYVVTPVLDETGIEGGYDFELAMDHWIPGTVCRAVEQLGLKLVKTTRNLDVLVIEKGDAGTRP
jgi:hypothetical protein